MDTGNDARRCDEDQLAQLSWAKGVPAPVDADGNLVPLRTRELYTDRGELVRVTSICFNFVWWYVHAVGSDVLLRIKDLHISKPDSWEQLERDVYHLVMSEYLDDPEGDVKDAIRRAKALAWVSEDD